MEASVKKHNQFPRQNLRTTLFWKLDEQSARALGDGVWQKIQVKSWAPLQKFELNAIIAREIMRYKK